MSELFVFTAAGAAGQEHFERTILRAVEIDEIARHDPTIAAELSNQGYDSIRCWGSVPGAGNVRSWQRMQRGHWAMLYTGGGSFPYLLRVAHKATSPELARQLWGANENGDTWELMFFFDAIEEAGLGIGEVRASLGYDREWWPQGLQYPARENQLTLLDKFGSLAAFVEYAATGDEPINLGDPQSEAEMLLGGPFKGAPDKPPKPRTSQRSDPDVAGRGYMAHERTVERLAQHIGAGFRKGTPGINHDGGWIEDDGAFSIAEIKSINARNEVGQLQKGLGQVLHNRFKARQRGIAIAKAYLVSEKEPSNSELWQSLAGEHGVVFTWPERFEADVVTPESAGDASL